MLYMYIYLYIYAYEMVEFLVDKRMIFIRRQEGLIELMWLENTETKT